MLHFYLRLSHTGFYIIIKLRCQHSAEVIIMILIKLSSSKWKEVENIITLYYFLA